jgi:CoA:oxalate CoA-transferase
MVVQAMGGIMSITGAPGGDPTRVGTSIGDIAAGMFCAIGIVGALYDRTSTGVGQFVDVAMLDSQVAILENAIARYVATGEMPAPLGSRHPSIAPFAAFRAADAHLVIAVGNDALFRTLCDVIGEPSLATDDRFRTNPARTDHVEALTTELEHALSRRSVDEWLSLLGDAGIPCGPINDVRAVLHDPQVLARNMVVDVDDPRLHGFRVAGNPIKLSGAPDPTSRGPVPDLE